MTALDATKVAFSADAAPTTGIDWHSIDWARCHLEVRKLQVRIAKATELKHWRKVKALQWLLTHSYSAKALAVRRVTENQGKRTTGVDRVTWDTPQAKAKAIGTLVRRGYQPKPLRRVYIPKANGKRRPLGIPTMKDRAMQALHAQALEPVSETTADWNSYGFRPARSTADAIAKIFSLLSHKKSAAWVLEGDIKGCFDHISHAWMLENICTDTSVLAKWLKAGFVDNGSLYPTTEGTPQGGIISPILANLALDGLEDMLIEHFGRSHGLKRVKHHIAAKSQVQVVRYADDFVITGSTKELLEDKVKPLVRDFLASRGLTLSEEKTKVTHVGTGFDFLGQNVRKYHHGTSKEKLLIKPSKKNVKTFLDAVRTTIRKHRTSPQSLLIKVLNPKIRGWANYHQHVVSKDTYNNVDKEIWQALWRWAKRRHPNKSRPWILSRYFKPVGARTFRFSTTEIQKNGQSKLLTLRYALETAIRRHVKIREEAQPFNPAFETYFEERFSVQMENNLQGRRRLLYLWRRQKGLCPVCAEAITRLTRWHTHHLVRRVDKGPDTSENLALLHPLCHTRGHATGFKFLLPVGSARLSVD